MAGHGLENIDLDDRVVSIRIRFKIIPEDINGIKDELATAVKNNQCNSLYLDEFSDHCRKLENRISNVLKNFEEFFRPDTQ